MSAVKQRSFVDRLAMGFALFFVSAPVFWIGLMFLWLFWFKLRYRGGNGVLRPHPLRRVHVVEPHDHAVDRAGARRGRLVRADDTRQPHRGDGRRLHPHRAGEGVVRDPRDRQARPAGEPAAGRHDVRDGPGLLFGGAIIVETVFNLQGIGQWAVASVSTGDLPVILAVTLVSSFAITLANVLVDVCYAFLDPRVRLE